MTMTLVPSRPTWLFTAAVFAVSAGPGWAAPPEHPRFTPQIEGFVENFKPGGQDLASQIKPLSPEESLKRLQAAPGYKVELAASEPMVRQPIDLAFDHRGRLWVTQYLQYPFPAGLTITAYDQYLRADYDRTSPPPPRHFRGADKVTILEDKDGDGKYETAKNFVEGLNMATSIAIGDGGVWILQSPYLLFYPDKNGDDVPDGDPEVHLSGFGLEDTHSLASNMHWGPDGWLYGATGSTTNLDIQGIVLLGQGIWRYHPGTKVFEIFAEGGGNTFSLEFDKYGRAYSGTNNGATRGLHYAQGATYIKGWTKHGPAMNPFIFGFFEHMGHQGYSQRFPQTFIFYEGGAMPQIEGQIVVGMSLTNRVQSSQVFKDTSSFRTVDTTALITSEDKAFRPVDIEAGPDGGIYIGDWYDVRLSHLNPHDTWDKSNGRIFRIVPENFQRPVTPDLAKASTTDLIKHLSSKNRWYREHARQLLVRRPEPVTPTLTAMLRESGDAALEALWVLNLRGQIDQPALRGLLGHASEHVRRWAVRLLGDQNSVEAATRDALAALAKTEPAVEVRSQLASSAKRLPAGQAFPILRQLLTHDEDIDDKHIPLLIWWAIESKAITGKEELMAMMRDPAVWQTKIFSRYIAERVAMRYTADQGPRKYYTLKHGVYSGWLIDRAPEYFRRNLEMCARLLAIAPNEAAADLLVAGMSGGFSGAPVDQVPAQLQDAIALQWRRTPHRPALVALAARLKQPGAMTEAVAMVEAAQLNEADQQMLLELFSATGFIEAIPVVAKMIRQEKNEGRRTKLLTTLNGFSGEAVADLVIEIYGTLTPRLQIVAQRMLSEKPEWAAVLLQRMNEKKFNPGVLSGANVEAIRGHKKPALNAALSTYLLSKATTPTEKMAEQLFEQGKNAYALNCSACHQENGQGMPSLAPSLIASPFVQQSPQQMARIILNGKENPGLRFVMPPLKHLDDNQIAAAIAYVRREFGNQTGFITPTQVGEVRAATADRQKAWSNEELAKLSK